MNTSKFFLVVNICENKLGIYTRIRILVPDTVSSVKDSSVTQDCAIEKSTGILTFIRAVTLY